MQPNLKSSSKWLRVVALMLALPLIPACFWRVGRSPHQGDPIASRPQRQEERRDHDHDRGRDHGHDHDRR
jgi:ABC-type nickel/cobalt efflux system permease component RcnA